MLRNSSAGHRTSEAEEMKACAVAKMTCRRVSLHSSCHHADAFIVKAAVLAQLGNARVLDFQFLDHLLVWALSAAAQMALSAHCQC